jgi:hypothetical protein
MGYKYNEYEDVVGKKKKQNENGHWDSSIQKLRVPLPTIVSSLGAVRVWYGT